MSVRKHLRPGKKWLTIKSSEMTWDKGVKGIKNKQKQTNWYVPPEQKNINNDASGMQIT